MKLTISVLLAASLFVPSCKKSDKDSNKDSNNEKGPEQSAKVTAQEAPTKADVNAAVTEIPITTKSEEARAAYIVGRDLADDVDFLGAEPHLRKAVELDPSFAQAHAHLLFVARADEREALRTKTLKLAESLPPIEKEFVAAMLAIQSSDPDSAATSMDALVAAAPNSWRANIWAGGFYGEQGFDLDKSEKLALRAAEIRPDHPAAYNILAYIYAHKREHKKAVAAATKQVELRPELANAHDTKADMELLAGKFEEAEKSYRRAYEIDKKFTAAGHAAAATQLYRKDFEGATKTLFGLQGKSLRDDQRVSRAVELVLIQALTGDAKGAVAAAVSVAPPANKAGFVGKATEAVVRARIWLHEGDWKKAHQQSGKAVAALTDGKAPERQRAFVNMTRLITSTRIGDKPAADAAWKALSAVAKSGPMNTQGRGYHAWAHGKVDEALAAFSELDRTQLRAHALHASAAVLDSADRKDEANAKRAEARKVFVRDIDAVMRWLSISKDSK